MKSIKSLIDAFNRLDSDIKLDMLVNYFIKTNITSDYISNIKLCYQTLESNQGFRQFVTLTTRQSKQEIELETIIENLLLNYSDEKLKEHLIKFENKVKKAKHNIEDIEKLKNSIDEFKNSFDCDLFIKANDSLISAKNEIATQLNKLNFKNLILNSDVLFNNFNTILGSNTSRSDIIGMLHTWYSEGFLYYSLPTDTYGAILFNDKERAFFQVNFSDFKVEINDLFKSYIDDISLPTKSLRHNGETIMTYYIHFDDIKNWLLRQK